MRSSLRAQFLKRNHTPFAQRKQDEQKQATPAVQTVAAHPLDTRCETFGRASRIGGLAELTPIPIALNPFDLS